jgi:hypothetical protein
MGRYLNMLLKLFVTATDSLVCTSGVEVFALKDTELSAYKM